MKIYCKAIVSKQCDTKNGRDPQINGIEESENIYSVTLDRCMKAIQWENDNFEQITIIECA